MMNIFEKLSSFSTDIFFARRTLLRHDNFSKALNYKCSKSGFIQDIEKIIVSIFMHFL